MPALGRRLVLLAGACLAAGAVIYELMPRPETRIANLLSELSAELNQTRDEASLARLELFLRRALRPAVEVHVAELEQDLSGVDEVSRRARDLLSLPPLSFAWSAVEIHVSGKLARVDADLLITVRGSGEQHRDLRRTRVRLVEVGDAWQIEAVEVEAPARAEPEARP